MVLEAKMQLLMDKRLQVYSYPQMSNRFFKVLSDITSPVTDSQWHGTLHSWSQCTGLSFLSSHNVGRRGESEETEDGRMDEGLESWRDRGLWMDVEMNDGMRKRGMLLLETEGGRLEK